MSEELSAGVRIILSRFNTNPDEMMDDYGKWAQLRDSVFDCKERGHNTGWTRGLRADEIDLLYDAFKASARKHFDDWVMQQVLGSEEKLEQTHRIPMLNKQRLQGSWDNVTNQISNTSIEKIVNKVNQGRK